MVILTPKRILWWSEIVDGYTFMEAMVVSDFLEITKSNVWPILCVGCDTVTHAVVGCFLPAVL